MVFSSSAGNLITNDNAGRGRMFSFGIARATPRYWSAKICSRPAEVTIIPSALAVSTNGRYVLFECGERSGGWRHRMGCWIFCPRYVDGDDALDQRRHQWRKRVAIFRSMPP